MVLQPIAHHPLPTLRKLGLVVAYVGSLIAGTALLIAVFSGPDGTRHHGANGQAVTYSELVMQNATERALVSPQSAVLAGGPEQNEKRGL
ncbi:MAG: hypothetical protein EOO54_09685 [Haliea sp.]|nr:MAG: hypothetical protein EOO54_09685 [Haliea sp.]